MFTKGLKELTADERDENYALGGLFSVDLSELPPEYRIEPLSIKNQLADGCEDCCTGYALTGLLEPKEGTELYPLYSFAAAKYVSGDDPDEWGADIRSVCKGACKWGAVPTNKLGVFDKMAGREFDTFSGVSRTFAHEHKQKSYSKVTGFHDPYDNARAAMWKFRNEKRGIIFGVRWGWDLKDIILDGDPEGFGHCMYAIGWDSAGIIAVNSAGKEAGDNGTHRITRETFNINAKRYGVFMLTDMERDTIEYMHTMGIKIGDGLFTRWWKTIFS